MDWLCPGYTLKLGQQLQKFHGALDARTLIHDVLTTFVLRSRFSRVSPLSCTAFLTAHSVQTGDLHAAVYDLSANEMHISTARASTDPSSEPASAYARQFVTFEMTSLFAEPPPL